MFRWRNKEWADNGVFIAQLALQVVIGGPRSDKTAIHQRLPSPQTAVIARQWIFFSLVFFSSFSSPSSLRDHPRGAGSSANEQITVNKLASEPKVGLAVQNPAEEQSAHQPLGTPPLP